MKQKLDTQVAAAVGAMLVGRVEITLEDVADELPGHIRAAGPSLKSMTKALAGAGWIAERREGGSVVYVPPRPDGEEGPEWPELGTVRVRFKTTDEDGKFGNVNLVERSTVIPMKITRLK